MTESGGMSLQEMAQYYYENRRSEGKPHDAAVEATRHFLAAMGEEQARIERVLGGITTVPPADPPCDQRGCPNAGQPCWLSDDDVETPSFHYCWDHMAEQGFCVGCGRFWAGIERFDFNPRGLCENCDADAGGDEEEVGDDDMGFLWDDLIPPGRIVKE